MSVIDIESFRLFEKHIVKTGNTYVFDDDTSVEGITLLLNIIKEMGLNPFITEDFKKGIQILFNVEIQNMPDLDNNCFILAPNHVSDMDAIILGLLHPKLRIVSKNGWTENKTLKKLLDIHYDLYGLDRTSLRSLHKLLNDSIHYFNDSNDIRHFLVFSQGTISDFNNNSLERISPLVHKISTRTDVPIVTVFVEQASLYYPTRIVFGEPMKISKKDNFRQIWLDSEKTLQNQLSPPARQPILSHKHMNNNKLGDPFF